MSAFHTMKDERDALEEKVEELEREVRLMRQQYFRRLEERDALQAEKADLLTALEQTLATLDAVCEMQGFDKYKQHGSKQAREAIAKAKGGE